MKLRASRMLMARPVVSLELPRPDPTGGGYQQHDPDRTPEGVARLAAGEFTERKLKARIDLFRETARLCDALAYSKENRLTEERAGLRRIR
jgi:hypothetical protein